MGLKDKLGTTQYGRDPNEFSEKAYKNGQFKESLISRPTEYSEEIEGKKINKYDDSDPNPPTNVDGLASKPGLNPLSIENSKLSVIEWQYKYVPAGRGSKYTTTEPFSQKWGPGEGDGYLDQDFNQYPYSPKDT